MVLTIDGFLHHIHFPDAATFWAFRYHALHGGRPLERARAALFTHNVLLSAWDHFTVPFEFPHVGSSTL